jgi:hypothetical protein
MALKRPISIVIGIAAFIAGVLAFYLDWGDFRTQSHEKKTPDVEIQFFRKESGKPVLSPSGPELVTSQEDVKKNRAVVPLNLAVHNLEPKALQGARIELSYPDGLEVKPGGDPKIDPQNRTLIYEHQLRILEPVGNYTPLDTVDTIQVRAYYLRFLDVEERNGLPTYFQVFTPVFPPNNVKEIEIGVRFFSEGRPPKAEKIKLTFRPKLEFAADLAESDYDNVTTSDDITLFTKSLLSRSARTLDEWVGKNGNGKMVAYRKVSDRSGIYQFIKIRGGAARIIADTDRDGFVDWELSGTPGMSWTTRRVPKKRLRVRDWHPPITTAKTPDGETHTIEPIYTK